MVIDIIVFLLITIIIKYYFINYYFVTMIAQRARKVSVYRGTAGTLGTVGTKCSNLFMDAVETLYIYFEVICGTINTTNNKIANTKVGHILFFVNACLSIRTTSSSCD